MDLFDLAERGLLPDFLIRMGIRRLCRERLADEYASDHNKQQKRYTELLQELSQSPLAVETDAANEQHYEVPAAFYDLMLSKEKKYSGSIFPESDSSLDQADDYTLDVYCERAAIVDGMDILELGCGWGSLSLRMALKFPSSSITCVSNSSLQREHINKRLQANNVTNVNVITCDMNEFDPGATFDRIVSIEMFEHMRNYPSLFERVSSWLRDDGRLFFQVFAHRTIAYFFEVQSENDWMSKYFFTGGIMPAADTYLHFQDNLRIEQRWLESGAHYQKTSAGWLKNLDKNKPAVLDIFRAHYGEKDASIWFQRWRMFVLACEECFGLDNGSEWIIAHFLFSKR